MLESDAPILELDHVGWKQQGVQILDDISWTLSPGDRWAILGPNGCGKSSLLKIACGHVWPSSGTVLRLGQRLMDLSLLKRSIGWVTSELARSIPPREPAIETVVTGPLGQIGLKRYGHWKPDKAMFDRAAAVLQSLNCAHLADRPFGVLSQGEKQQVLVARARNIEPIAIICDEPCAGMDPGVRERFLAWMQAVAADPTGPAWVLVTHHVEEIVPAFDQTLLMKQGRIQNAGPTDDVVTAENISSLYNVTLERLESIHGRRWPIWAALPGTESA